MKTSVILGLSICMNIAFGQNMPAVPGSGVPIVIQNLTSDIDFVYGDLYNETAEATTAAPNVDRSEIELPLMQVKY